jgi:choline kinase
MTDSTNSSPKLGAVTPGTNPVSSFMLDSRAVPGSSSNYEAEEQARDEATDEQVEALIRDAKLWRGMCSAYWVAWGIVQARIPEMDKAKSSPSKTGNLIDKVKSHLKPHSDPLSAEVLAKQQEAKLDRPESRVQEEAHREGDHDGADGHEHDDNEDDQGDNDEFDYLAYARDRALFFWGDCLQLSLVSLEELPADLLGQVKTLAY